MTKERIKASVVLLFVALALALGISACDDQSEKDSSQQDLQEPRATGDVDSSDVESVAPDKTIIIHNVNGHPNFVIICYGGVAHRTISSAHSAYGNQPDKYTPEWDHLCPGYDSNRPVYVPGGGQVVVATTTVEAPG